jgi:hypothetical protein
MAKKTIEETANAAGLQATSLAPGEGSKSIFDSISTSVEGVKMEIISRPPIIKPADMRDGQMVCGVLREITPSANAKIKSPLLAMEHPNGFKFAFPMTTVIASSLGEKPETKIGHLLQITKTGSKKGQGKGARSYHLFTVAVSNDKFKGVART